MTAKETIEKFKRDLLAESLAKITEAQRGVFNRCYPKGVSEDKLESAIDLCFRTIKKNEADPSRLETK